MSRSAARTRLTAVVAAVVGFGLTVPAVAAAAPSSTLYVNATGVSCSDTDGGTAALPLCTAQAAANVVQPGQTIEITGHAGEMQLEHSGTPDAPIIVEGSGDDDGPGGPGTRDIPLWSIDNHDVVLRNLHVPVTGGGWAVIASNTSRVTFDHNTFEADAAGGGGLFVVHNNHLTITRNEIDTYKGEHIRAYDNGDVIAGNVFGGSGGAGVHLEQAVDVAVTGNTFVGQCNQAVNVIGAAPGVHVENNLITQLSSSSTAHCPVGPAAAVKVDVAAGPGVTADYNLVHPDNGVPAYNWAGADYADAAAFAAATGQGRHDLNSDPQLGDNHVLREGSPAIDSANADAPGELATDINNVPRVDDPTVPNTGNGIHDRGAYEFTDSWTANNLTISATQAPVGGTVTVNGNLTSTWNLPFTCDIAFGDGQSTTVSPCQASHAYAATGTYTITTKAHNDGGLSRDYTNTVKVVPASGKLTPSVTATSVGALAVETKPAAGDDPWNIAFTTVDFGDGTGEGSAGRHTYAKPGTYTITANITDANGAKGSATTKFTTDGTNFTPYGPARLLDTRTNGARVPAGGTLLLKVGGNGTIPADVKAVAMNLTVTNPSGAGNVTAYADGMPRPDTSNVNYVAGQTVPNMTITPVGSNGYVDLHNTGSDVDLIADVTGYFTATAASAYTAVTPSRLLDTRTTGTPLLGGHTLSLSIGGDVAAVSLNVTVTNPAAGGIVTAFPSGGAVPTVSNLNFTAGQTVANAVIVPVGADGKISFYASTNTDLIVDVSGRFSARGNAAYVPIAPVRQVDTRTGGGPIPGRSTKSYDLTKGIANLAPPACTAIVLNATVTNTTDGGVLTVFSPLSGGTPPNTSNLNWAAGQTVPNLVLAQVQPGPNSVAPENFYVSSTTDLVVDVSGYFSA